jgi:hypothetical protein
MKIIRSEKRIMFVKSKACLHARYEVHVAVIVKVYHLLVCDNVYSCMSSAFQKNLLDGSSFMVEV